MSPGVEAEDSGTELLGKAVSDLQTSIEVSDTAITGTLKYNEGWASGPLTGAGHFLALKFTSEDWSAYDSVKVGLSPSIETGLVELDSDHNGVFKITDKDTQVFVVEARKDASVVRTTYDLSGLVLEAEPQPGFEGFISTPDMTAQTCAYPGNQTVDVTQSSITIQDNVNGYGEEFTGTISGQVYGYVDTLENTQYRLGFKIEEGLIKETSQIEFKLYDANNNEINLGSMMFAGSEMPANGYIAISAGSTNTEIDPEDIKNIVAEYVDYTDTEDVKFITVTYTTNLTKGS